MGGRSGAGGGGGGGSSRTFGGIKFSRDYVSNHSGYRTVVIDVRKFDRALAKDKGTHVGKGGSGAAIGGRYANAKAFITQAKANGTAVEMPRVSIDRQGNPSITDGRHRFAALRDIGLKAMPVAIHKGEAKQLERAFGAK